MAPSDDPGLPEPHSAEGGSAARSSAPQESIDNLLGSWLSSLDDIYQDAGRSSEFEDERPVYVELLPALFASLTQAGFEPIKPLAIGSTACVALIRDTKLNQQRALKIARPRLAKLRDIVRIMRAERQRLADLYHENITRIYYASEVDLDSGERTFPYFVMDYLTDVKDLDSFIYTHLDRLSGMEVVGYLQDVLSGLWYLHQEEIVHVDIKPGNILVARDRPAQIADFGYAKRLRRQDVESAGSDAGLTEPRFTFRYAHPDLVERMVSSSDPDATKAIIERKELRPSFDLFALGRSLQEILGGIRRCEAAEDYHRDDGCRSVFSAYQWQYLQIISTRLLDGQVAGQEDYIRGLPAAAMVELRYLDAAEALRDVTKLLNFYDLEGEIPELNPNLASYIQVPLNKVPLTARVAAVLEHPVFARLGQVTQLGFVSLLYPGATHTRLEHVLGTFATACEYIRALWYSESDCLFKSIMRRKDLERVILLALIHDVGQYPMAHDLTEVSAQFAHERFGEAVLLASHHRTTPLRDVIEAEWGIDAVDLLDTYSRDGGDSYRDRILRSIITGPIDADKVDYLRRDSLHLGVSFGAAVDVERLVRHLIVAVGSSSRPSSSSQDTAEIGVVDKALAAALSVWRAREDMHRQVYWHHTVRSLKAMLAFVVRSVLLDPETDQATFWRDFNAWLAGAWFTSGDGFFRDTAARDQEDTLFGEPANGQPWEFQADQLAPTDDSLLWLLWKHADTRARRVIQYIRGRTVYQRVAVLSGAREESEGLYRKLYEDHRTFLGRGELGTIEELRAEWEKRIIERCVDGAKSVAGLERSQVEELWRASADHPIVLVDIPVKSARKTRETEKVWYLPEDVGGLHSVRPDIAPEYRPMNVGRENRGFDQEVGKIRVLVQPEWSELVSRCLQPQVILSVLTRE